MQTFPKLKYMTLILKKKPLVMPILSYFWVESVEDLEWIFMIFSNKTLPSSKDMGKILINLLKLPVNHS
jgi:hypothetical protein